MTTTTVSIPRQWTVPATISYVTVRVAGASGAPWIDSSGLIQTQPGKGSIVEATFAVTPGDLLNTVIGLAPTDVAGGFPDGRDGNRHPTVVADARGGGGGTTLWINGKPKVIAGGGGGAQMWFTHEPPAGGNGGYPKGEDVDVGPGETGFFGDLHGPRGGTQTADGVDGDAQLSVPGGGGGGGYHLGGNGYLPGSYGGCRGGAGGSSWFSVSAETPIYTETNTGDGWVTATYAATVPPTLPTNLSPVAGAVVDDTAANVQFSWQHQGDSAQLQAELSYAPAGGEASPTVIAIAGVTNTQAVTMLADGDWIWRVRTWSQNGLASPWSAWSPFAVRTPPDAPSVTVDAVITGRHAVVEWTAPLGQEAWRVTVQSGPTTWDSGQVSGSASSVEVPFGAEGAATINVWVKVLGLWSLATTTAVTVAWVHPVAPVLTVRANQADASVVAEWTQPESDPEVAYYDVYAVEDDVVRQIAAGSTDLRCTYWTPASGATVAIRVTAVSVGDTATTIEGQ